MRECPPLLISWPRICGAVAFRLMFIFVGECRRAEDENPKSPLPDLTSAGSGMQFSV